MAKTELSNKKSICVLAVVVCCLAILWPKIFLPMLQSALSLTSNESENRRNDISLLPPKVREAMKLSRSEELKRLAGRPFQNDLKINSNEMPPKTGGLMGLAMPLYTIAIVVFFLYTILKLAFNKKSEDLKATEEEIPLINDFQMDPEYRKYILSEEYDENGERIEKNKKTKNKQNPKTMNNLNENTKCMKKSENIIQNYGKENDEYQIKRLQKRLEETEDAMERILNQMNRMSGKLVNSGHLPSPIYAGVQSSPNYHNDDQNILAKHKKNINEKIDETKDENNETDDNSDNDEYIDSSDVFEQNENELNLDTESEDMTTEGIEETVDDLNTCFMDENQITDEMIANIDSNVWESMLKGMQTLNHFKEE